ncbi:NmrA/HSCARG family protein [Aureispira]|nr:NmrA/HSCARG family protein [Aureispira sp.]
MSQKIIAICGARGAQGGSVLNELLKSNEYKIRALSRHPNLITNKNIEAVYADYDKPDTLEKAFEGCYGVFLVTNFWEHMNPKKEYQQGVNLVDAAKKSGVKHIVWSTLEDTRNGYEDKIPFIGEYKVAHFDEKGKVEKYLNKLDVNATNLYTSFYWENLLEMMRMREEEGIYNLSIPIDNKRLPGVAIEDIGKIVSRVFHDKIYGKIGVASEHLTGEQMAHTLNNVITGGEVKYNHIPFEIYRKLGFPGVEELSNMFEFKVVHNDRFCERRNMDNVKKLITPVSFKEWCEKNKDKLN